MEEGLKKERLGCHFCEATFKTQQSRTNHHAIIHPKEHKKYRYHKKSPDYPCKHCHIGFGSRRSKWNHEQRCLSNPGIIKQLKILRKSNDKVIEEELNKFVEENKDNQYSKGQKN